MSKIEVNTVEPQCGTTLTVGKCTTSVAVPGNVVKSNALQASDGGNIVSQSGTDITLGASGDTIALACGASQTGFGRTGTVDWDTSSIKTTGFTAVSGNGYFCNTTGGGFTATLPSSPSAGDIVALKDYALTWQTSNLTVGRGGSSINGQSSANPVISTQGGMLMFVYADGTKGWIPVQDDSSTVQALTPAFMAATGGNCTCTCGDYKIHKFTGPGTLCVSAVGNALGSATMSYIVVAGGGGAGSGPMGGGGGAGGFREGKGATDSYTASPIVAPTGLTVTASPYSIVVGGGGAGGPGGPEAPGGGVSTVGSVSTFSTICSAGGGNGKGHPGNSGGVGGTAGGTGGGNNPNSTPVVAGNTPPVSPPQGFPGGDAAPLSCAGGGGGGATASNGTNVTDGGTGATTAINFSPTAYAGGGGAGAGSGCIPTTPRSPLGGGVGGTGGGGDGAGGGPPGTPKPHGEAGTVNTGGGGGGASREASVKNMDGGAGGSGIVIIRYKFQ